MAAGLYTFTIEQGATYTSEIQWKNAAETAVDLTGYTAKMQLRDSQETTGTLYLTLNTSGSTGSTGICLSGSAGNLNPNEGKLGITITATDTAALDFGTDEMAYYDLEMTKGAVVTRLLQGKVKLSKQVTN
tara:strand:+ start:581 stop:973 length:393 start_codon:yes stop_codon:yes gene_type:complete